MRRTGLAEQATLLLVALALAALLWPTGCADRRGARVTVVSVLPLKSFVEAMAGERMEVDMLVPPSSTPHTFEPKPSDIRALADAKLFVLVGLGLEAPWADKMIQSAGNARLRVVKLAEGVDPIGDPPNPHVWLSPKNALTMADNLEDALIAADPSRRADYERNAKRYGGELRQLHREYRQGFADFRDKRFVATRPTFAYLARDYGLEQAAVIAGTPGQEPSARRLAEIIHLIQEEQIPVLVELVQVPETFTRAIVEETGVRLVRLDPMGVEHPDYRELMEANLEALVEGFSSRGDEDGRR